MGRPKEENVNWKEYNEEFVNRDSKTFCDR
jgi:hypothetical protein